LESEIKMNKPNLKQERMHGMGDAGGVNYIEGLDELCLFFKMNKNHKVLELGCNDGVRTSLFAYYADVVDTVDIVLTEKMKNILNFHKNINFKKGSISQIVPNLIDDYYDFIYIDADHSFHSVVHDINVSLPKLKKTGIMSGHDYIPDSPTLFGVSQAVNSLFNIEKIKVFSDYSWAIIGE